MKGILFFPSALVFAFSSFAQTERTVINNSSIAFTIPEKDLIPENLAYNPAEKCFYVGSTHKRKVVKVTPDGKISDFIKEQQDGEWMVVGMKIDTMRNILWFCSAIGDVMKGYHDGDFGAHAGIFKYDLSSGRLIKRYLPEQSSELHFFNDLVLNREGDVFITDMAGKAIYSISSVNDELKILCRPSDFSDPNGICISPDEQTLFVATNEGISSVNIQTGKGTLLKHPAELKTNGIDGLYFHQHSLIAVQSGVNRIIQFFLNNSMDEIVSNKILEENYPFFTMNPTTGVIVGNTLYYIANSQFGSFDSNHQIFPMYKLYEVVILKVVLN